MRAVVFDKPRSAARVLRALAFTACVPYLALKIAWVSGSRVGIPDGSMLLEHHTAMIVGNSASVLIDSMVVVLALLLTQPWGRRAPVWLLILPVWAATGLLSPIMVGYPLQLGARLLGGTAAPSGGPAPARSWTSGCSPSSTPASSSRLSPWVRSSSCMHARAGDICGEAGSRGWRGKVRRVACSEPRL